MPLFIARASPPAFSFASLAIGGIALGVDLFSSSRMGAGLTSHLTKDRGGADFNCPMAAVPSNICLK